ncbi:hypothetical protein FALBO_11553 [Fusarium albosuccineum]|uniref:Extracellular membrane protein CFEM domain-containing protein n=1 Tax=Fusarium albosuccineum TaxID=1237068 RepID=A0A8H4P727_9HYPO|nr:hypothetical protein FALBO_11553 [Fusarium albosuccineum]
MRPSSTLAALVALAGFSSAEPNGWSKTKEADDSPTKLDDCGCWPIYQAMLKCQKLKGPNADTKECVCIPNPDGWYPSMDGCRNCLSPSEEDFFDNVSRLVTQLFVSCTNAGGGVTSDGVSICASNYYREACVSLGTGGKPSWASFEEFEDNTKGNASYVLDIEEYGADKDKDEDESTSTTGTAAKKTAATTVATTATDSDDTTETSSTATTDATSTGELSPAGSGTSDNASGTETSPASASTVPSSATKLATHWTVAGAIRGAMVSMLIGAVLF